VTTDKWASWLLHRRDGGAPPHPSLLAYRDGVLDRAGIRPGDVVLDVGTGTGLIGFGALERVGPAGEVIFSDVSSALLDECRRTAGDDSRCSFVLAGADDLTGVADASVDVVTTRSVLMYVADRERAFGELARVLRPGGRLSVFEPINSFAGERFTFLGYDLAPVLPLVAKVLAAYDAEDVIMDFDERDLLRWTAGAGFTAIEMDYRAEMDVPAPPLPGGWETVRDTAPNPLAPTYREAMEATLTAAEREHLESHLRAALESGEPRRSTLATAYLRAVRG
jgi:arsenite methyltransferase